jgi:hypothetical protein
MAEQAPWITILCSQCSRHTKVRQGEPLPEGWTDHLGLLSCSEACRDTLQTMGLISEAS